MFSYPHYSRNPRQNYICVYQTHLLADLKAASCATGSLLPSASADGKRETTATRQTFSGSDRLLFSELLIPGQAVDFGTVSCGMCKMDDESNYCPIFVPSINRETL